MGKYYGVYGKNAIGIYDDYKKVQLSMKYLEGANCKKFGTFSEAKEFAVIHYNQYQTDPRAVTDGDLDFEINWMKFRKFIIEKNKEKNERRI